MRTRFNRYFVLCLVALVFSGGYADTRITERKQLVTDKLPRPDQIWVYDFAATSADLPADSALAQHTSAHSTAQTAEQIAMGRQLGAELASELVSLIQAMHMPARRATDSTRPQPDDIVLKGYLVSMDEGDELKRITIGFGKGASELTAAVEGFQMTAHGLRKIGGGSVESTGGKKPGTSLGVVGVIALHNPIGLIVSTAIQVHEEKTGQGTLEGRGKDIAGEIATVLKQRFAEQGWIGNTPD